MTNDQEQDYNGLPPLGCEASPKATELENTVGWISDCLVRVAAGTDAAFNASEALCSLQSETLRRAARISPRQRDQLLRSLATAHGQILHLFKTSPERTAAVQAVYAVAGLICWWAEAEGEREARPRHIFSDYQAYTRWLRNACHNRCLLQEIEARADTRRNETVIEIMRRAAA